MTITMSGTDSVQTAIKKEVELIIMAGSVLTVSVLTVSFLTMLFSAFFSYNKTGIRMPRCPYPSGGVWLSSLVPGKVEPVPTGGMLCITI
jgi:hypothetical protein